MYVFVKKNITRKGKVREITSKKTIYRALFTIEPIVYSRYENSESSLKLKLTPPLDQLNRN